MVDVDVGVDDRVAEKSKGEPCLLGKYLRQSA